MNGEKKFARNLVDFINESPSPFHVAKNVKYLLEQKGFKELDLRARWNVEKFGKYFVKRNNSTIVAFVIGDGEIEQEGFKIIGAHTDSPTLKIKPAPEMVVEKSYVKLNIEVYGNPILNSWLDRPLSMAGRVSFKGENPMYPEEKLLNVHKPILIIPNLAIHMNRNVNQGVELNKQKDMLPLLTTVKDEIEKDNYFVNLIAEQLSVDKEQINNFEIFLYEYEKGSIIGLNDNFISSGKLDDLAMVHAGINALMNSCAGKATNVMVCFDNEEPRSKTKQGADSLMLRSILERIVFGLGKDKEDYFRSIYSSFIISSDMAHALHPNSSEKYDPINKPIINKGPVIKFGANLNFTTDSDSSTVYESICGNAGIPVQRFTNRSDITGGSTIGPITTTQLDIRSIDIRNPILAMHSIRELGGVLDHYYIEKSFEEFYK